MKNKKQQRGFSIVEVLVVSAIMAIMLGILFAVSTKDRNVKEALDAGRAVASAIRETQTYALAGQQREPGVYSCEFTFSAAGSKYDISYAFHEGEGDGCKPSNRQEENFVDGVDLGTRIDIRTDDITFIVPHGTLGDNYEVEVASGAAVFHICVSKAGLITEAGFGAAGEDLCGYETS